MIIFRIRMMLRYWFLRRAEHELVCSCGTVVATVIARSWFIFPTTRLIVYENSPLICEGCRRKDTAEQVLGLIELRDRAGR